MGRVEKIYRTLLETFVGFLLFWCLTGIDLDKISMHNVFFVDKLL